MIPQSDLFTLGLAESCDVDCVLEIQRGSAGLREIRSRDAMEHVLWNMFYGTCFIK